MTFINVITACLSSLAQHVNTVTHYRSLPNYVTLHFNTRQMTSIYANCEAYLIFPNNLS